MKKYTLLIIIPLLLGLIPIDVLLIENMYTGEIYVIEPFNEGDTVTMRWIHSVELEPWEEIFGMTNDHKAILIKTRFKAFGAGVPDSAGEETYIEDDYVVYDKINQVMDSLTYGVSPIAKHTLMTKKATYPLYDSLPADTGIRLAFDQITVIRYLWEISKLN